MADIDEDRDYLKIGSYTPGTGDQDASVERDWYRQGYIFKDEEAFLHHPEQVCYVPELSDAAYTRQDFLDMCNGQEEFAEQCFHAVDWQHPETWVEEQYRNDEWGWCEDCRKIYDMEGEPCPCPECGSPPESGRGSIAPPTQSPPTLSSEARDAQAASMALGSRDTAQGIDRNKERKSI